MIKQDFESLRHSRNNADIVYTDLLPGDRVWVQGNLFEATNIYCHRRDNQVVIRFLGLAIPGYNSYIGTEFDNSIYGAREDIRCTIVKRDFKPEITSRRINNTFKEIW